MQIAIDTLRSHPLALALGSFALVLSYGLIQLTAMLHTAGL
jgi:hypothetical protein